MNGHEAHLRSSRRRACGPDPQTDAAAAEGIELDSREYKLMLEPERFAGGAPQQAVRRFVRDQLEPAVRRTFGDEAADELKDKGFDLVERRSVRFWDTDVVR